MTKVDVIIQARMGSTRLPGKVMKEVLDQPLLRYVIERSKLAENISDVIIATSSLPADDQIALYCIAEDIPCFRGSEEDVLSRYLGAAKGFGSNVIVRITGDCPLIDPTIIDEVVATFLTSKCDFASNVLKRTFPRGMDVEVFSKQTLEKIDGEATNLAEREHVTLYVHQHLDRFYTKNVANYEKLDHLRLTVDTEEDLILIKKILKELYPENPQFKQDDIVKLLKKHPEWAEINAHVKQKNYHDPI